MPDLVVARSVRCWVVQRIATSPHGLDVVRAASSLSQLFAQLADENINDRELGSDDPAVKMIEDHFLGQGSAFSETQQFKNGVFFTRQAQSHVVDCDRLDLGIEDEFSSPDS